MKSYFLILLSFLFGQLQAQTDFYDQLKKDYDRFRKEEKYDSALVIAKQMNAWAMQIETDTSLRYAVSMRYMGLNYINLQNFDSSLICLEHSMQILEKQHRQLAREYTECLNLMGICYRNRGEFKQAEAAYLKAIEIRKKHPTNQGDKPRYQNNLGFLYVSMGLYNEAEKLISSAVKRFEELYAVDTSKYISSIHSLAAVKYAKGEFEEADKYFSIWLHWTTNNNYAQQKMMEGIKDCIENNVALHNFDKAHFLLNYADSILYLHPEIKNRSQNAGILYAHANLAFHEKKWSDAIKYYEQTISFCAQHHLTQLNEYADAYFGLSSIELKDENLERALEFANKALDKRHEKLGGRHPEYATSLKQNAKILTSFNRYKEAIKYLLEAEEILEAELGVNSKLVAEVRKDLGINYRKLGLYRDSEIFTKKALDFYQKEHDIVGTSTLLNNLGYLYLDDGNLEEAQKLIAEALGLRIHLFGADTSRYYAVIHSLAKSYYCLGDYRNAKFYFQCCWDYLKKQPKLTDTKTEVLIDMSVNFMRLSDFKASGRSLSIADSLIAANQIFEKSAMRAFVQKNWGDLSLELAEFEKALNLYHDSEKRLKNLDLSRSKEFSQIMLGLSKYYLHDKAKNLNKSLDFIKEAAKIQFDVLGSQHAEYANTINIMGIIYNQKAQYDSALVCFNRSLKIKEVSLGTAHSSYASTLNNLAVLFLNMGAHDKVLPLYEQVLNIKQAIFKSPHKDIAISYNNIAMQHQRLGNFQFAEDYFKKALAMRIELGPADNPVIASSFIALGNFYKLIGDYTAAWDAYKLAAAIWKNRDDDSSDEFAYFLIGRSELFLNDEDFRSAEADVRRALKIYESIDGLGTSNPKNAVALNSLGRVFLKERSYHLSDSCFQKSLIIRLGMSQKNYHEIARSYRNLGDLSMERKDYIKADEYYRIALSIADSSRGKNSPLSASINIALAKTKHKERKFDEFYALGNKLMISKTVELANNFEWLNDYQRELYWKKESSFFEYLSEVAYDGVIFQPGLSELNYNACLILKGQLLEARIANKGFYGEIEQLREDIAQRRKLMIKIESDGIGERKQLDRLSHEADSLDKLLTTIEPGYAQQKKNLSITWKDIQQNLEVDEAAIEFVRFQSSSDSLYRYAALVVRRGDKFPVFVNLCREDDLKSLSAQKDFSTYYDLIWRPLEAILSNIHSVYYSPVGELNNISFGALYKSKDSSPQFTQEYVVKRGVTAIDDLQTLLADSVVYLMDIYKLHQLTSTRYLAFDSRRKESEIISKSIALVGAVNYDFLMGHPKSSNRIKTKKTFSRSAAVINRLEYLDGTRLEAESILDTMRKNNWRTEYFAGSAATEENIIRLEAKHAKSILHIATHGYAFQTQNRAKSNVNASNHYSYRYSTNPMVRSGLILAGGNWAWIGSDTLTKLGAEQNGILTALEVSQLNLKKTKLVVLSACETGLGKIEGSEGTFGLKRGFKLAGVEQMIVSLWSVPDKETMELMTLFYTDLTKTLNPVISFEKAQKEMRNTYPTEPEKWAGFVLVR